APLEQRLAQVAPAGVGGRAAAVADVPLPGGDDLERLVALLEEVDLAQGRLRLAVQVAAGAQRLDALLAGGEGRTSGEGLGPQRDRGRGGDPGRRLGAQPPVVADDRPGGQVELAPPLDVGEVAEGAA